MLLIHQHTQAIQTFLDVNCNGWVDKDDFVNQFLHNNMKQKWL